MCGMLGQLDGNEGIVYDSIYLYGSIVDVSMTNAIVYIRIIAHIL